MERTRSEDASDQDAQAVSSSEGRCTDEAAAPAEREFAMGTDAVAKSEDSQSQQEAGAPSQNGSDTAVEAASDTGVSCVPRQDMLQYKQGRLSKHELLVATAKQRIATRRS